MPDPDETGESSVLVAVAAMLVAVEVEFAVDVGVELDCSRLISIAIWFKNLKSWKKKGQ